MNQSGFFVIANSGRRTGDADDDSAAVFDVTLDQPIGPLGSFSIELVSSVLRKRNSVVITDKNNTIVFRMGTAGNLDTSPQPVGQGGTGEQYVARVATGAYANLTTLTDAVAFAMNQATPCNAWRGWSCTFDNSTSKFTLTLTPPAATTGSDTSVNLLTNVKGVNYGYDASIQGTAVPEERELTFIRDTTVSGTKLFNQPPQTAVSDDVLQAIGLNGSFSGSDCGATSKKKEIDTGSKNTVEAQTCTAFKDVGVQENNGRAIFDLTPHEVVVDSNYIHDETYYTFIDKRTDFRIANQPPSPYDQPAYFWKDFETYGRQFTPHVAHPYVSGLLCAVKSGGTPAGRGAPYNKNLIQMAFPAQSNTGTNATVPGSRIRQFRYTFEGNLQFRGDASPYEYALHQDMSSTKGSEEDHALSTFYLDGELEPEPTLVRRAVKCLKAGLPQSNAGGHAGEITQTFLEGAILTTTAGAIGSTTIEYQVGSVGVFNIRVGEGNRDVGTTFDGSNTGRRPAAATESNDLDTDFILPIYKILEVSADKKEVTKAILLSGGEYIEAYSAGTGATPADDQALFFNDPRTFVINDEGTTSFGDITLQLCTQARPAAGDISGFTQRDTTEFRYLASTVGVVDDVIFHNTNIRIDAGYRMTSLQKGDFIKNLSVEILPKSDSFFIRVLQFQPSDAFFDNGSYVEDEFFSKSTAGEADTKALLLNGANPADWNTFTYTGIAAPAAWTVGTAVGAFNVQKATGGAPDSRLRIEIQNSNIFSQSVTISYSTDQGATYINPRLLTETGVVIQSPGGTAFSRFAITGKARNFPLHVCASIFPTTGLTHGGGSLRISGNFSAYDPPSVNGQDFECHSKKNYGLIAQGSVVPTITSFAPFTLGAQNQPEVLLKTGVQVLPVANGTAYPLPADSCEVGDIPPATLAVLGDVIGLSPAYTVANSFGASVNFAGGVAVGSLGVSDTILVELLNYSRAITGHVASAADYLATTSVAYTGGSLASPIIGCIPASQITIPEQGALTRYVYQAEYPLPIIVSTHSDEISYIKNLSLRLRTLSGESVQGLVSPSTLVMRIVPHDKKSLP